VQGNVYMIVGPGGNTAVQISDSGALVVDTQYEEVSDKIVAEIPQADQQAIRTLSIPAPIRITPAVMRRFPAPARPSSAAILARSHSTTEPPSSPHENVLRAMSGGGEGKADTNCRPLTDHYLFPGARKEIFFNEEPVIVMFEPAAHTNGDSMVFFPAVRC